VIADLGVNHVERAVLRCGYTATRVFHDYGIDLRVETYDRRGQVEAGEFKVQVKATDSPPRAADGQTILWRVEVADLRSWLFQVVPVVLVVYDATGDVAYWLDVQEYAHQTTPAIDLRRRTVTVRIPVANVWTPAAVRRLRVLKNRLNARQRPRYPDDA
jgi:hypothetical protein